MATVDDILAAPSMEELELLWAKFFLDAGSVKAALLRSTDELRSLLAKGESVKQNLNSNTRWAVVLFLPGTLGRVTPISGTSHPGLVEQEI